MRPGFGGAETTTLASGAVDLVAVGRDVKAAGAHLRRLGHACAEACPDPLVGPLAGFAGAVAAYSERTGEHVAALGWLGSHLAEDLDLATGGF
ncbi:hypothetical protein D9V37_01180 [Nocardioides mangrovicus]|uniref:Uncharacterized protein n=1 Tax=Nocardioides mangrovicus TaxID=2478913 RepID=A0A3L8P6K7_9ACTN|nr:hypothetical protein [Nocardioides mangrovicus]RLV50612.1 hypothetical protein D9V37_01180 [Nocardioides mangrovicus]